jgi:endonuclease/exonuclease/phosphatase family metal-dependent hydrolase
VTPARQFKKSLGGVNFGVIMQIVTYNIQWGKGQDEVVDLSRIARTVAKADVICLQEVECNWREMADSDQVARLAALLPDHYAIFSPTVDLHDHRENATKGRRQYGLMLLSRWPILSTRTFPLPKYPVHASLNDSSGLQEAVIAPDGKGIRIYNTHLNYLSQRQRRLQIDEIMKIIADAPLQGGAIVGPGVPEEEYRQDWIAIGPEDVPAMPIPAVLTGDFNMRPNSPNYDQIVGERDPFYGRLPDLARFSDVLTLVGQPEHEGSTHPEADPEGFQRIDHVFVSGDLVGSVTRAWIDAKADGSDHQPVFAELSFP